MLHVIDAQHVTQSITDSREYILCNQSRTHVIDAHNIFLYLFLTHTIYSEHH